MSEPADRLNEEQIKLAAQFYLNFYNSARQQLIGSIAIREQIIMSYVAIAGAGLAFAISQKSSIVLMFLGMSCVAASILTLQHHLVVGQIAHYVGTELMREIEEKCLDSKVVMRGWDSSDCYLKSPILMNEMRFWGQLFVLVFPALTALALMIANSSFVTCATSAEPAANSTLPVSVIAAVKVGDISLCSLYPEYRSEGGLVYFIISAGIEMISILFCLFVHLNVRARRRVWIRDAIKQNDARKASLAF